MRIIAGIYRGRKLQTLEGLHTRPTLEATKGAIFSSMGEFFPGCVTLDVFGGSGALTLEAVSRGVEHAYIIDNDMNAMNIIKSNIKTLKVESKVTAYLDDYKRVLDKLNHMKFDIVFLDPPFRLKVIDELITYLVNHNMINEGGFIMAEYPKEDIVEKNYEGFRVKLCKRYSSSEILILERE